MRAVFCGRGAATRKRAPLAASPLARTSAAGPSGVGPQRQVLGRPRGMASRAQSRPERDGVLSWPEIDAGHGYEAKDERVGPANSHATVRLFDLPPGSEPEVVLYRDNHYWCPYCQKVALFLESKRIPYEIKLVTMFCYGDKEAWYKKLVPSGMLPALSLKSGSARQRVITESDDILLALEDAYGPLGDAGGLLDEAVVVHRRRERKLFRAWCMWLCRPSRSAAEEEAMRESFVSAAREVEAGKRGRFMLGDEFSVADVVYVPYLERMSASLFYYKGYALREEHPALDQWFSALESLDCYRGHMSDFSTHAHDLPPQMGGCYTFDEAAARAAKLAVDQGPFADEPLVGLQVNPEAYPEPSDAVAEAVFRVARHRDALVMVNPFGAAATDLGLRCALTLLLTGALPAVDEAMMATKGVDKALRYIRDRVSVPRDMPLWSGMRLRQALETAADSFGDGQGEPIRTRDRYDQNPVPFGRTSRVASYY